MLGGNAGDMVGEVKRLAARSGEVADACIIIMLRCGGDRVDPCN